MQLAYLLVDVQLVVAGVDTALSALESLAADEMIDISHQAMVASKRKASLRP
jgi:hypothetical protein